MTIAMCASLGFTTGIDDEDLPPEAKAEIAEDKQKRQAEKQSIQNLSKYGNDGRKIRRPRPGRTPVETLEENILQILDSGKARSGDVAKEHISVRRTQLS